MQILRKLDLELSPSPGIVRVMSGAFLLLSAAYAFAAETPAVQKGERRGPPPLMIGGTPPQEALEACLGMIEANTCNMKTPHGEKPGTCGIPKGTEVLACMPEGMAAGGQGRREVSQNTSSKRPNRPRFRKHAVTQTNGIDALEPASVPPIADSQFTSQIEGDRRIITSNSISEHMTGAFPNANNPNAITEFALKASLPANPVKTQKATRVKVPGYAFNGVSFDPGAGEFYQGDPSLGWQYEPLSGAVNLGLDENHAHVQPTGKYHYHGLPTGLLKEFGTRPDAHSPQIGWAVDGFPIYALYGFVDINGDGGVTELKSSYRLKSGARPTGERQPGGTYDGTFTADYEYVADLGDLDECNGRMTITPDFPNGTYAYYLTDSFPVVPRCVMGTPERRSRPERR